MATEESLYEGETPDLEGFEADLVDAVSREEPWALVERFAELERVSGSEDERQAAAYLCDRLDELGIDYERHEPELYRSVPRGASLAVTDPEPVAGPLDASLVPGEVEGAFDVDVEAPAVKTVAFSGTGTVAGELLAAPRGNGATPGADADADGTDLDALLAGGDLPGDVGGRIVVVEGLLPVETIREAEAAGAAAVVVVHPHPREPHEGIVTPVWGGVAGDEDGDRSPSIPVVTVARPVGERLFELAEREEPVFVEASADVETGWASSPVVVAGIEAGGEDAGEEFVLAHGHYDSWHAGVGDNATGDAALLELARVFDEHADGLRRDLRVAWWPAHSTGRYAGSRWYAEAFALDLDEHCLAHVNVDSPGTADATALDAAVWMPEAGPLCTGAVADVCGKRPDGGRPPRAGDYSFSNLGVTGLFMLSSTVPEARRRERGWHPVGGCGGNADAWHLSTDTLDVADPDVLVRDTRVYATVLARLCREPVVPLDFREAVVDGREAVREYHDAAGDAFDLGPALDALDALDAALERFHGALDDGVIPPDRATDALRRCSRALVRAGFTTEGRFEQDPAVERPPYPGLAPAADLPELPEAERRRAVVDLRQARNRVVAALREARRAVEDATPS